MFRTAAALPLSLVLLAACGPQGEDPAAKEARESLLDEVRKTREEAQKSGEASRRAADDVRSLQRDLAALSERVARIESEPRGTAPETGTAEAPGAADRPAKPAVSKEEFDSLRKKVFDGTATDDEEARFWELARTSGQVDAVVKDLEAKVKASPGDLDARMDLAQAYIAKLLTLPGGPEQGVWSGKAEKQWNEVLKADPDHWDAQFSLAFNWSMWPDFLNKTPDAVKGFEKAREIQERRTPAPEHAQTYFQLSRLYAKQGKTDKAKDVLRAGLERHPDDANLRKALDSME
ncbi:MAG: hypothetical protein HMLKMBBP_02703 [Planctomycetes bacterium]|nr:hypothetical protein [Planctomycetota bacterium]